MRRILVILVGISLLQGAYADLSLHGTAEGNFTVSALSKDSPYSSGTAGDYGLDNYILFNAGAKLSAGSGAGPGAGSGPFVAVNADVLFQEMRSSQNNQELQSITPTLNEAYLSAPLADFLFFTLGKRRIVWGTGLSYNPSDFINPPKDPLNPQLEKRGVYSAMLELFTEWLSVTEAVVIYDQIDAFGSGTKLSTSRLVPSTDVSLIFYYSSSARLNIGAGLDSTPFGDLPVLQNLALHAEAGFSQVSDRPVYDNASGLLAARGPRDDFYKSFLTGLRFTIPGWETLIVAEYFHIDDGYSPAELGSVLNHGFMAQVPYEPGLMSRNNLMISITQSQLTQRFNAFTDSLAVSAVMLLDIEDSSLVVTAKLESSVINNWVFALEAGYFVGASASEYGISPKDFYVGLTTTIGF